MRDSEGKPWKPHLSEWARGIRDEISGKNRGYFTPPVSVQAVAT